MMGRANPTGRSFEIPKRLVYEAWKKVRANDGAPGVDRVSITEFESRERDLLYKLWNGMSAGSYSLRWCARSRYRGIMGRGAGARGADGHRISQGRASRLWVRWS